MEAFDALERRGWEDVVGPYDRFFGPLTRQCVPALLRAAGVGPGSRVLDVATGPGFAAAAAAEAGAASVTALDFSGDMLRTAREQVPGSVVLVQGDAQALPFGDCEFDAVVCNFGVLHLGRPEAFLQEACRVLAPGGRLAFTVWEAPPAAAPFAITLEAVEAEGDMGVDLPVGPPFFRYAARGAAAEALEAAGFEGPQTETVPQAMRLGAPEELFELFAEGTVRTRALLAAQTSEAREAIAARMAHEAGARGEPLEGGGLVLPAPAAMSYARKPL